MKSKTNIAALIISIVALVVAVPGLVFPVVPEVQGAISAQANVPVYTEQGGAKLIAGSGGEIEAQSGSTVDIQAAASLNVGSLYPALYSTAGQQVVVGTSSGVTETVVAAHGLTTVTFALCSLGEDVDTDANDPVVCTAAVSANVVTLSLWEDDWSAAGTAAKVHWLVVGTP